MPWPPGPVSQRPQAAPATPGLPGPPALTYSLSPSILHLLAPAPKQQASGPHLVCEQSSRARSGQAQNEPTGLSQASVAPEGPGTARGAQRPSPALRRPSTQTSRTGSAEWPGCFPSTRGSEAQRVIAPCTPGLVFQKEPGHVPSSPPAPENMGFCPWAGKWWNRLERTSRGPDPGPALGRRCLGMLPGLSGPQFPQTPYEREMGIGHDGEREPRTAHTSPSFSAL